MSEIIDRSKAYIYAAAEDLMEASPLAKTLFFGGVIAVGAHVVGAETLYSNVGVNVFNTTHHNPFLAGLAVGGASMAVETGSALVVSAGINVFPRSSELLSQGVYKTDQKDVEEEKTKNEGLTVPFISAETIVLRREPSKLARIGETVLNGIITASSGLAAGSPGYILQKYSKDPTRTFRDNMRAGVKAIGALAIFDFVIATGITSAVRWAQELGSGWERAIQTGVTNSYLDGIIPSVGVLPIAKSPLFWWSLLAGSSFLKRWTSKNAVHKGKKTSNNQTAMIKNITS